MMMMMKMLNFLLSGKFHLREQKGRYTKRSREQALWGNLTVNISTTFFFISNWLKESSVTRRKNTKKL